MFFLIGPFAGFNHRQTEFTCYVMTVVHVGPLCEYLQAYVSFTSQVLLDSSLSTEHHLASCGIKFPYFY